MVRGVCMTEAAFLRMVACPNAHSQCSVCSCGCEIKVLLVETSLIPSPYFSFSLVHRFVGNI